MDVVLEPLKVYAYCVTVVKIYCLMLVFSSILPVSPCKLIS